MQEQNKLGIKLLLNYYPQTEIQKLDGKWGLKDKNKERRKHKKELGNENNQGKK